MTTSALGDTTRARLERFRRQDGNRFFVPEYDHTEPIELGVAAFTSVIEVLELEVLACQKKLARLAPSSRSRRQALTRRIADCLAVLAPLHDAELAHLKRLTDSLTKGA